MYHINFWWFALAAYLSRPVEIMVINATESMKQSESKQLAGFIFTCCISLGPTSPLLAGFTVQSLLAVLLCQLVSTEEVNSWNAAVLGTSSGPYAKIWVGEAEGTTHVSWYHIHVFQIAPLYSFEHVPIQKTYTVKLLDCLD